MNKISVVTAMLLLVIGNIIAVFSDAVVKTLPSDIAVYQFVLFRQLSAVIILIPFCLLKGRTLPMSDLKWHVVRGHIWLFGVVFMVYAITSLPLATVNAIFYAAPLIMLPLARLLFNETLSRSSIAVAVIGFIGVLVIVRPTEINWAATAALIVAFSMAANNLLIRKLPTHHNVIETLLLTNLVGIPAALCLTIWEGKLWDWSPMLIAGSSTSFILVYAGICVLVYRSGDANKIASAEYSGLLGAVAIGVWFFDEIPDLATAIGSGLIILPLIWLAKRATSKPPAQLG